MPTRSVPLWLQLREVFRQLQPVCGWIGARVPGLFARLLFDFRSLCVRECGDGKYATVDGLNCEECDAYCRECNAASRISCLSCYAGYTLRVLDENTQTGECMQDCRKGFFRDAPNDLRCIQCGKYCDDCNSLYNCFECEPGATLFRGICYLVPTDSVDQTIDFSTYLASGAGADWDDSDAPGWELLSAEARRLEQDLFHFDPTQPWGSSA